jgi:hypothetical protein
MPEPTLCPVPTDVAHATICHRSRNDNALTLTADDFNATNHGRAFTRRPRSGNDHMLTDVRGPVDDQCSHECHELLVVGGMASDSDAELVRSLSVLSWSRTCVRLDLSDWT